MFEDMSFKVTFVLEDLGIGGAQRHTVSLIEGLSGMSPTVIGLSGGRSEIFSSLTNAPIRMPGLKGMWKVSNWVRLSKIIKRSNPDVVVAVNQISSIVVLGSKILGLHKAPVVSIFHSTKIGNLAGWVRTIPYIILSRTADRVIFVSRNQMIYWTGFMMSKRNAVSVVNGIDVTRYEAVDPVERRQAKKALGISEDDFVVGCVAVLRPEKNHVLLIRSFSKLVKKRGGAKLLLVGSGPCLDQIDRIANECGVRQSVIFAGMQADVKPFLAAMDVKVLASSSIETLSIAALEAMAMSVPVVLSRIGGATEIVKEGETGYTFGAGGVEELYLRLDSLAVSKSLADMGKAARSRVERKFSISDMLDRYECEFRGLIR